MTGIGGILQPVYGLSNTSDPFRFAKLAGHAQALRVEDPIIPLDAALEKALPPPPWEAGVRIHWLSIHGVQPNIPENVPMLPPEHRPKRQKKEMLAPEPEINANVNGEAGKDQQGSGHGGEGAVHDAPGGVLVKAPLKHVLSKELNMYMDQIMKALEEGSSQRGRVLDATLASLRLDAGLQPLAPYLCHRFADKILVECGKEAPSTDKVSTRYHAVKLVNILRAAECIASNRTVDLSWYLHELIPAIMDVILDVPQIHVDVKMKEKESMRELNRKYRWDQREFGAKAIASICSNYPEVAPRVQKQFVQSLKVDPEKYLPTIYGAILGLACQGQRAVQTLLLPNMIPLIRNIVAHAKQCSTRELDIVRNALLSVAGPVVCNQSGRLPQDAKFSHVRPSVSLIGTIEYQERRASNDTPLSKAELFSEDNEDPCIQFCQDPESVKLSQAWLRTYVGKAKMHSMSGASGEAYHPSITYKLADGKIQYKHTAAYTKCIKQLEVFPSDTHVFRRYASLLQDAYAQDANPAESLNLIHDIFGRQSDPYVTTRLHTNDVFL